MNRRIQLALCACVLAAACGGKSPDPPHAPPVNTCPIGGPVTGPTLTANILPVLQASCGSSASSCHGGSNPAGHVPYDGSAAVVRAALVNQAPANAPGPAGTWYLVAPGNLAKSWIVEKITKDAPGGSAGTYGARMPYAAGNLCAPTVQAIEDWITAGAPL